MVNNPTARIVKMMDKKDIARCLSAAQAGDADAFATLFESYRPMLHAIARRVVGPDDADDAVMETYLKAWRAVPRFKGRSSLKTWLYRITNNCALDMVRARGRRENHLVRPPAGREGPDPEVPDHAQTGPDERLLRSEQKTEVRAALALVPEEHRVVLLLRYADGMSYAEIAAAAGVSTGTVMSRLFYGKRKLKQALKEIMETRS